MPASESSSDLWPSPDDDTNGSAADPTRWLAGTIGVEEIWVDWQLCPPDGSEPDVAPTILQ